MPRYERLDHKTTDRATGTFWEIEIKGLVVEMRTGRIGPQTSTGDGRSIPYTDRGTVTARPCRDAAHAKATYDKLIFTKLRAGFVLAPGAIHVAERNVEVHRNAALEANLAAATDDVASYLVYGDWLQAQGDPRGELVHVQHAMRGGDASTFMKYKRQDEELRAAHARAWLGEVVVANSYRVKLDWKLGFVDTARVDAPEHPGETATDELIRALLDSAAGCLVRTLIVRARNSFDFAQLLGALPASLPALRKLELGVDGVRTGVEEIVAARPRQSYSVVVRSWER